MHWHRDKILEYTSQDYTQREIAAILQVTNSMITEDYSSAKLLPYTALYFLNIIAHSAVSKIYHVPLIRSTLIFEASKSSCY